MIVLIPWKPVVVVWLLLSAMLWCGYVGSSLMEGKNPFAPYTFQAPHDRHPNRSVHQQPYPHDASDRPRSESEFAAPRATNPAPAEVMLWEPQQLGTGGAAI